ncbi:hypothetical protein P280DRAFT_547597 [Massarina eburnea CBS 473.64]|uniref:Autophagy-related protein 29 n=1 Tax=Massarina eburnea CBS 473.64 TaxID=1395130 RepID=A0A6A6SBB3_9PLEO|nr:hypothetical protein P280DRAFT_547597 [Massarina eburnea CBS 473.64]
MSSVQFTALIRVPFSRGDFVEPPQVSWDASKDRSLWKVVSKSSKASDLNWVELADNFDVPPAFLLQQAAWLYERHLDHVRAQLKKVGGSAPTPMSLDSTHTTMGGIPMKRIGSGGSGASRTLSVLSVRPKEGPTSPEETGMPAPSLSRTPSTTTITQSRALVQNPSIRHQTSQPRQKSEYGPGDQDVNPKTVEDSRSSLQSGSLFAQSSSSSNSSPSDSDDENPAKRSQLFKRPPRFRPQRPQRELLTYDEDIDEADEHDPGTRTTLPFAKASATNEFSRATPLSNVHTGRSPGKINRVDVTSPAPRRVSTPSKTGAGSSMTSSASDAPKGDLTSPGPLSPRHQASLAKASPMGVGQRSGKEGSEGTPSMGSSFSDIDDVLLPRSSLTMEPPTIRVEEWYEDPPITTKYIRGGNELDFYGIWGAVKKLRGHPGRGKLALVVAPTAPGGHGVRLMECSEEFLDAFWECMAKLLDYFADFLSQDTATMKCMWFHLLDVLQEVAELPHQFWDLDIPSCEHSKNFAYEYQKTLRLINKVIAPSKVRIARPLVRPHSEVRGPGSYDFGKFKAGLKPWQQFLCKGAPGLGAVNDDGVPDQYLPMGALSIIEKHTERARKLTSKVAQRSSDGRSEANMLSEFDKHSFKSHSKSYTYTSIEGHRKTAEEMDMNTDVANAPRRDMGLGDPSCLYERPNVRLLDETAANYRGIRGLEGYVHPDGSDKFHMMAIRPALSDGPEAESEPEPESKVDLKKYHKMFNSWKRGNAEDED